MMTNPQQMAEPNWLADLNPVQRQAVAAVDGPVLVLAGAGTGKTRVLTRRLAYLLAIGRAMPGQILAVTFTNKASREMKERVSQLLGGVDVEGWWLGTFHALAARMLRRHAALVNLTPQFTIIDSDDQVRLLKQILQAEGIDDKKWPAKAVLGAIERWKDQALSPAQLPPGAGGEMAAGRLLEIYRLYQERLQILNACDFGDLLLHMVRIWQQHPDVLAHYHQRFRYLLVDEYQDSNSAQYLWLRLLAAGHKNICCVGDDDQSIYGWRGAEIGNILRFEKDFPGATIIRLEENYRSHGHILAAASGLIAHNQGRLGKSLWTKAEAGDKVQLRALWDGEEEARFVADEIEALQRRKVALQQMAILVRAGFQTREFEERFLQLGIPYRVVGGARFYERLEIRDALAYFRITVSARDDLAFERIINTPKRGLGPAALQTINLLARGAGISLLEAASRLIDSDEIKGKARAALRELVQGIERWHSQLASRPHGEVARVILDESGYTAMWQADKSLEAAGRLENLKELVSAVDEFSSLPGFLEHVSLVMDNTEQAGNDLVSIMTLHGAKGLEFDYVFLPGWEEGIFPSQRSLDENGTAGLEEERRLAYVGITRARRRACISYAGNRRLFGQWNCAVPSRFIGELPAAHIQQDQPATRAAGTIQGFGSITHAATHTARGQGGRLAIPALATPRHSAELEIDGEIIQIAPKARVFHPKFGYGTVLLIDYDKLEIDFDQAGRKKVMAQFVRAADGTEDNQWP